MVKNCNEPLEEFVTAMYDKKLVSVPHNWWSKINLWLELVLWNF